MINILKNRISNHLININGWKTNKKIIVIESDDWGSIRMPSTKSYHALLSKGIAVDKSLYCKYDSIESNDDLIILFETIKKFKDKNGKHPVITANTVVANPDFDKIRESKFKEYFYEPFTETLKKYPHRDGVFSLYKEGIESEIFFPQFHGREHVNVELWLNLLISNNTSYKLAFNEKMWGLSTDVFPEMKKSIQATFDSYNDSFLINSITEGLLLFEHLFGYKSNSFIANNFIWNSSLNKTLADNYVNFIQGMKYQIMPKENENKRKLVRHHLGEANSYNQIYLIRNCNFEPTLNGMEIDQTISEIKNAFFWKKPAIISTHRINFIGGLDEKNRKNNIKKLSQLISRILKIWPEVEFMNSIQLGDEILKYDKIK